MIYPCKVTVIRRSLDKELISEYLDPKYGDTGPCDLFSDGQEFIIDKLWEAPEGFCQSAWADIRHEIMRVATGGDMPGMRQPGVEIASCHDWFRPVIFQIERIEQD